MDRIIMNLFFYTVKITGGGAKTIAKERSSSFSSRIKQKVDSIHSCKISSKLLCNHWIEIARYVVDGNL